MLKNMRVKDLLNVLPLSRSGIYQMIHTEGFPLISMGKRKLIPKDEFLHWLSININPSYRDFHSDSNVADDSKSDSTQQND